MGQRAEVCAHPAMHYHACVIRTHFCLPLILAALLLAPACRPQAASRDPGPIRLDPRNPHYFLFRGKTIALVTSGEHYGAVINPAIDFRKYLETLAAEGMNETRLFGGSYVEAPGQSFGIQRNDLAPAPGTLLAPWARSGTAGYAGGGNKFDLDEWDPAYFARLHDFLAEASRQNIVVEISLFSSQYGDAQWALSPLNPQNNVNHVELADWKRVNTRDNGGILRYQEAYVRKIVREVNAFDNVIFEIQNEPWSDRPVPAGVINPYLYPPGRDQFPNSVETADADSLAWQAEVAGWITSEEAQLSRRHLIAQCYSNFRLPVRDLVPGVSIVNFHYAYPDAATWNEGLGKAIAYDETGFLGRDDAVYLRQAWNFLLSGGGAFDALDYSFSPGHEDGTDAAPNGPGGGSPELRRELSVLSQFINGLPLEHMQMDSDVVVSAPGVVTHALGWTGEIYAIYFDGHGPVTAELALPAGDYTAVWVAVQDESVVGQQDVAATGAAISIASPGFDQGIVLLVQRKQNSSGILREPR
jgi:hypothetical protein